MEQRTLLVVDGSAEDRARYVEIFKSETRCGYRVQEAGRFADAVLAISEAPPDCVLLQGRLPDGDAIDFLRASRDASGHLPFPALVLSESGDPETAVALMRAGAQDYLLKAKAEPQLIRLAVNSAIEQWRVERAKEERRARLERLHVEVVATNHTLLAANSAKDDFLAILSHELRTPLTPVLSLVSSNLNDPGLRPELQETFSTIQRNVEIVARLIDDLLDLTQIESGRLRIETSPVDVHRCIEAAIDVCATSFDDKRISLRKGLAAANPMIMGEFPRLTQAIWNLLKNTAKFGRPRGFTNVDTWNQGNQVVISIRDNGVGIEPDRIPGIFGGLHPIKPRATGTGLGLGLALARAIVEGHHGTIEVRSEGNDRGAEFRITLPSRVGSADGTDKGTAVSAETVRGRTVMVVEDHEDTRREIVRALRRAGFGVTSAGSLQSATDQFLADPVDLILCDIGLPDGTGWELMERLRPHGPIRAIAVSGYGMPHDLQRSSDSGFIAHLTKPVDIRALARVIVDSLALPPPPRSGSRVPESTPPAGH